MKLFGLSKSVRAVSAVALVALLSSCSAQALVPKCSRIDVPSMGPENSFRVTIPSDTAPNLTGIGDRIELAISIVPPLSGPVTLVQSNEGRETGRWVLEVGPGSGISTRCRIGTSVGLSTCKAAIGDLPHSSAGQWSMEPGNNRVLEAGLSFRVCR